MHCGNSIKNNLPYELYQLNECTAGNEIHDQLFIQQNNSDQAIK